MEIKEVTFYTDSKVDLGYIQNECRRFYVYIAHRVQTIRKIFNPKQWKYVDTSENPAHLSTRCLNAQSLTESNWLTVSLKTQTSRHHGIGADRFTRFSSLYSLQRAIANLILVIKEFKRRKNKSQEKIDSKLSSNKNTHLLRQSTAKELQEAIKIIIRTVQRESLSVELKLE